MNAKWQPDAELQALLAALFDGDPTPDELAALNDRLHRDSQARAFYVRTMSLHARLHARYATQLPEELAAEFVGDASAVSEAVHPQRRGPIERLQLSLRRGTRRTYEFFARTTPLSITVATLFVVMLLGAMATVTPPIYRAVRATAEWVAPPEPVVVAQITDSFDAEWPPEQIGGRRGAFLVPGQKLDLIKGLVEITFRDGARVLLDGPARLEIGQQLRGEQRFSLVRLDSGKLSARVPEPAVGFTVATPHANFVDLGTEFGVVATAEAVDIEVFAGRVVARDDITSVRPPQSERPITSGHAWRFPRDGQPAQRIAFAQHKFMRLPSEQPQPSDDAYTTAVLADQPQAFWPLSEERSTLAFNHVGRPHGIIRGFATQGAAPRPGAGDTTSTLFDGHNYIEVAHDDGLNSDSFTVEAWVRLSRPVTEFASVVTSRTDEPATMGFLVYISNKQQWEFWTGRGDAQWSELKGPAATVGEWTHVVVTFAQREKLPRGVLIGTGRLYLNGKLVAENDDMHYMPLRYTPSPLRIAAGASEQSPPQYFLPGQIADVALYARALTADQVSQHYTAATTTTDGP